MKKKTLRNILVSFVCLIVAVAIGAVVYSNIPTDNSTNEQSISAPNVNQDPIVITDFPEIPFSVASLCKEATDIAVVRVLDWLGEYSTEHSSFTYFEAEIVELVYGESLKQNERFTLFQEGSSEYTVGGYPLYKIGNEFLIFLKSFPNRGGVESVKTDYVYRHIGTYATMFDQIEIGQSRFLKVREWSHISVELSSADVFADNIEQAKKNLAENDTALAKSFSLSNESGLIYDYDKLTGLIKQNAEDD